MPRRQTPRLSEALQHYQRTRAVHVARMTSINDQSVLRRFVEGVHDPMTHALTAQDAEAWFAQEAGRQGASSYNNVLQRVRGFLAFCGRRGWLVGDPLAELRPRRVQAVERLRLSAHQLRALVDGTEHPRDRAMLAMAVNTGLRASDLVALKVRHLDLENGWIQISVQKTGDADRLPVTMELDAEMRRWLSVYTADLQARGRTLDPDAYLFPAFGPQNSRRGSNGRPIFGPGWPNPERPVYKPASVVQRALVRIGIPETHMEGFHTIRRSVGRLVFELALESGHDGALRTAAALLGHKSVQTTELYLGVRSDRIKRDQLLRGKSLLGAPETDNVVALDSIR